jgi:hypothetical protein
MTATTRARIRMRHWVGLAIGLVLSSHSIVSAEPAPPTAKSGKPRQATARKTEREKNRPELFAGFSHSHSGSAGLNGWVVSGSIPYGHRLELFADLSHHSGSFAGADLGQLTFLGGIGRTWYLRKFRPFGRVLLGIVRDNTTVGNLSDSASHLAFGGGGGVTYPFSSHWGIRGQLDLLFSHGNGSWDTSPRLGLGADYRF